MCSVTCVIKGWVLYMAAYGHVQDNEPFKPSKKSRELSWSKASTSDFSSNKGHVSWAPLRQWHCSSRGRL